MKASLSRDGFKVMDLFFWPDGSFYTGEWKDNLPHGQGIFTWPDGREFKGLWERGQFKEEKSKLKAEMELRHASLETLKKSGDKIAEEAKLKTELKDRLKAEAETLLEIGDEERQKDETELRQVFWKTSKKSNSKVAEDGKLKTELKAHLKEEAEKILKAEEETCLRVETNLKTEVEARLQAEEARCKFEEEIRLKAEEVAET